MIYLQSLRARTFGIAEDMQLGDVQPTDKLVCLPEVFIRFATRTHDDVYTDKGIGHHLFHLPHLSGKKRRIVTAAHQFQHFVATWLQRDMEVGHEAARACHELDDFIGQQIRFYRRDAITLYSFHFIQCSHQVEETLSGTLSEIADIDTGQYNLLTTLCRHLTCLLHHRSHRTVTAPPTSKGNRAIRTEVVATVLHL